MKKVLLNSFFGRMAVDVRDSYQIIKTALLHSDNVGELANKQLAYYLVVRMCDPQKVFVDAGSHIGLIVYLVISQSKSAEVIGIEPMPDKVADLRNSFPNVTFHECALGASNCEASFNIYPNRDGFSSLVNFLGTDSEPSKQITVNVRKLDDIAEGKDVDVIKLVVEGSELEALKGGQSILKRSRPIIMFESGPFEDEKAGNTIENRWRFLNENNYGIYVPNRIAHDGKCMSLETFVDSHIYPRRALHYFAIPTERRQEVKEKCRAILNIVT